MQNSFVLPFAFACLILVGQAVAEPFDKAARWEAWQNYAASYEPDLSDSSKYLSPPETGRLAKPVPLAEKGEARAEIVVDLSDAIRIENFFTDKAKWSIPLRYARGYEVPVARNAAFALRDGLKLVTGADFAVRASTPAAEAAAAKDGAKHRIFLGATFARDLFPDDLAALTSARAFDGFAVREKDGNLYIFGAAPAGTLYGVHTFLENNTDLIWAFPDATGTIYTRNPDLEAVWGDARDIPVFVVRGWQGGEETWMMRNRVNFFARDPTRGFFMLFGGHYLCPQYYDFCVGLRQFNSMNAKGVRNETWDEARDHACLSDPAFLPRALESVPNLSRLAYSAPYDCVFGMDDNSSVCHCPKCKTPIQAEDGRMLTPEKDGELFWSAWFYTYLNKVDDAIQKEIPGYVTSTFAYFFAKQKPPIKVNKTIVPWICTYPRNILTEPIYSPRNEVWQKVYEGWAAHSQEIFLYDYYGFLTGHPYAEIYKEELAYQRSLGFLATSTEGFMRNDPLGAADERWCMSRLSWNPDLSPEELHRYFNRRAYREAAPAMDKLRGAVRKAYYAANNRDLRKVIAEAKLEDAIMAALDEAVAAVRHPGAKRLVERTYAAWTDFLGRSAKTAGESAAEGIWRLKSNKERVKVGADGDRCIRLDLAGGHIGEFDLPSGASKGKLCRMRLRPSKGTFELGGYPAVLYRWKERGPTERCESRFRPLDEGLYEVVARLPAESAVAILAFSLPVPRGRWVPPTALVEITSIEFLEDDDMPLEADVPAPKFDAATIRALRAEVEQAARTPVEEMVERGEEAYLTDRLVSEGRRRTALVAAVCEKIKADETFGSDAALAYFRKYLDDDPGRAWGYSQLMDGRTGSGAIASFAAAFAEQGRFDEAVKTYDAWENWDGGDRMSLDVHWSRRSAKMAFLKRHSARPSAKALYDAALPGWRDFLRRCAKEAGKSETRGRSELALLAMEKGTLPAADYTRRVEALLMDAFMPNTIRYEAAILLPAAYTADGKTDWAAVEKSLWAALESGDWSNLARTCYTRQSATDLRLNALVSVVNAMADGGDEARAKALIEKGGKLLGYDKEPLAVLEAENRMIPHTFERTTLNIVKGRFATFEKCRARFDKAKFEIEAEPMLIDLDEL